MSKKWYIYRAAAERESDFGNIDAAEKLWLSALEEAEDLPMSDARLTVTLESLAEIYFGRNDYLKSAAVCRRICKIYEDALGQTHADVGTICCNLALIYYRWGRFDRAEKFYRQSISILVPVYGNEDPRMVKLLKEFSDFLIEVEESKTSKKPPEVRVEQTAGRWAKTGRWQALPPVEASQKLS